MKQDFLDAVSSLVGRLMEDSIHTSAPSKVGKVENNHTAKLTPNLKVTTDDGREVPYPEISGTIILMPCGAGGTVGFAFPAAQEQTSNGISRMRLCFRAFTSRRVSRSKRPGVKKRPSCLRPALLSRSRKTKSKSKRIIPKLR